MLRSRLRSRGGTGATAVVNPLRFASVQNRSYQGTANSGVTDRYYFRVKHVLGANMSTLSIGALNWTLGNNETNTGNGWTYQGISLELVKNSAVVPVTWSGVSTKALADGENNVLSDEIPASAFGTTLDRNDEIWIKGIISMPAGGLIPYGLFLPDYANSQTGFFLNAVTTPSSINAAGIFTFTGVAPSGIFNIHSPILLGRPIVDGLSYFGAGDSILYGLADDSSQGAYGRGFFQRSMHTSFASPFPSCNFSTSGIGVTSMTGSNTKWTAWAAYANRGVEEFLTNNAGDAVATQKSNVQIVWSRMKAAGITKIIRTGLMARVNTTDSYATLANQTPISAEWDVGGNVAQMNAWFPTRVGTDIEAFCNMQNVVTDNAEPQKWIVNGVANRMTSDGLHPYDNGANGIGNATAGTALRNTRTALN